MKEEIEKICHKNNLDYKGFKKPLEEAFEAGEENQKNHSEFYSMIAKPLFFILAYFILLAMPILVEDNILNGIDLWIILFKGAVIFYVVHIMLYALINLISIYMRKKRKCLSKK